MATLCQMDFGRFLDVIRAFEHAQVDYVLVGWVAVNLHGIVRATEDIDFFVRPEPDKVERLKRALRSLSRDPDAAPAFPRLRRGA